MMLELKSIADGNLVTGVDPADNIGKNFPKSLIPQFQKRYGSAWERFVYGQRLSLSEISGLPEQERLTKLVDKGTRVRLLETGGWQDPRVRLYLRSYNKFDGADYVYHRVYALDKKDKWQGELSFVDLLNGKPEIARRIASATTDSEEESYAASRATYFYDQNQKLVYDISSWDREMVNGFAEGGEVASLIPDGAQVYPLTFSGGTYYYLIQEKEGIKLTQILRGRIGESKDERGYLENMYIGLTAESGRTLNFLRYWDENNLMRKESVLSTGKNKSIERRFRYGFDTLVLGKIDLSRFNILDLLTDSNALDFAGIGYDDGNILDRSEKITSRKLFALRYLRHKGIDLVPEGLEAY